MKKLLISFISIFMISLSASEDNIRNSLKNILPDGAKIESIEESSIPDIFAVYYGDLQPIYVTKDGSFFIYGCLLYTSPSPRDATLSRMPSSA